jgi:hypothetical protein
LFYALNIDIIKILQQVLHMRRSGTPSFGVSAPGRGRAMRAPPFTEETPRPIAAVRAARRRRQPMMYERFGLFVAGERRPATRGATAPAF